LTIISLTLNHSVDANQGEEVWYRDSSPWARGIMTMEPKGIRNIVIFLGDPGLDLFFDVIMTASRKCVAAVQEELSAPPTIEYDSKQSMKNRRVKASRQQ